MYCYDGESLVADWKVSSLAHYLITINCNPANEQVAKAQVYFAFSKSEKNVSIEVIDDGEGISPAISSEIFNMFYRGSERSHGQGLGLYIVKSVVERMKGQIRWISKSGKTTFQIILPEN